MKNLEASRKLQADKLNITAGLNLLITLQIGRMIVEKETKSMCRSEHKLFIQDLGEASKHNPQKILVTIATRNISQWYKFSGSDGQAGGFNKYFHPVFEKPTNTTIDSDVADPHPDLSLVTITVDQLKKTYYKNWMLTNRVVLMIYHQFY